MLQGALQHIGEDLHITVWMGRKSLRRRNVIFIENPQIAKAVEFWFVVVREGKGMVAIQPAVLSMASVLCRSNA